MKMIISSILIITCIISLQSCRELDEQQETNVQTTKVSAKTENYNKADTIKDAQIFDDLPKVITETDPPPKDGGQWKISF